VFLLSKSTLVKEALAPSLEAAVGSQCLPACSRGRPSPEVSPGLSPSPDLFQPPRSRPQTRAPQCRWDADPIECCPHAVSEHFVGASRNAMRSAAVGSGHRRTRPACSRRSDDARGSTHQGLGEGLTRADRKRPDQLDGWSPGSRGGHLDGSGWESPRVPLVAVDSDRLEPPWCRRDTRSSRGERPIASPYGSAPPALIRTLDHESIDCLVREDLVQRRFQRGQPRRMVTTFDVIVEREDPEVAGRLINGERTRPGRCRTCAGAS